MIMGAAKDERGSVFRNTKFLTVESRPLWGPYVGKGPRSLGFTVCCYTVSSSTFEEVCQREQGSFKNL